MSLWRHLTRGLRVLTRREATDRAIADELAFYFDQVVAEGVARGLSPDQARRAARVECGNLTSTREEVRNYGWENVVSTVLTDVQYAARRLRGSPSFTVVAAITLGIAIGATTAVFSAVNPILFKALPYPHSDRILLISDVGAGNVLSAPTFGTYEELATRSRSFEALAATNDWRPSLTGTAEPERIVAQQVSASFARVWSVAPSVGREFAPSEDVPHGPRVAILALRLALRRFGSARAAVGQSVMLNGDPYTVVGVMPSGFRNVIAPSAELWVPLQYGPHAAFQTREWGHHLHIIGRLKPGVSVDQARAELQGIARLPVAEFGRPSWADLSQGLIVHSLRQDATADVRAGLLAILGAVLLVLAIASVNITNLVLARTAQRGAEFAVRLALGARRARLAHQLLTETLLLAAIGGTLGLGLAALGVRTIIALSPPGLPRIDEVRLDVSSFLFALVVTTVVGLAVGLAPTLAASRRDLHATLHAGSRRTAGGHQATRRGLVVAEIALALVLLVSTGLLVRSLGHLFSIPPGFDATHLITMQVEAAGHHYDGDAARYRFFTQALEAVHAVPGVADASFTSALPLDGSPDGFGVTFPGVSPTMPNDTPNATRYIVTPGYLQTMRIPLRRGRAFTAYDIRGGARVVLISASLAAREFPGLDPIGQRMKAGPQLGAATDSSEIVVGVVGDVKQDSLAAGQQLGFYMPIGQWNWVDNVQNLVVRAVGDPVTLVPALREAIWSIDRQQPISRIVTMDDLLAASVADRRFALTLFEALGGVALLLAAIGIHGVLSASVSERVREIGVRSALGASRRTILAQVAGEGMTLAALGGALGLIGALIATRMIGTLLYDVRPFDPITYLGMVALLAAVSAVACWLPAWRAATVDPAITLRAE